MFEVRNAVDYNFFGIESCQKKLTSGAHSYKSGERDPCDDKMHENVNSTAED